jgi:hypothetical protein
MNSKVFALACMAALAGAAPAAEAEADAQFLGYAGHHVAAPLAHAVAAPLVAPVAYHAAPAPTCVTEDVILVTQVCTPAAEEVCSTETVATQEIEYEKVCQEIIDTLCDAPVAAPLVGHYGKREAEAEAEADADAQYFAHAGLPLAHAGLPLAHAVAAPVAVAHAVAPLPVAHAVAHSVTETVKHACREVTTEHCVDNPKIIEVPVEVEHCHTVTKVTCADVENKLPKTTCEAVVTTATSHAAVAAPLPVAHHVAPVGYAYGH